MKIKKKKLKQASAHLCFLNRLHNTHNTIHVKTGVDIK